MSGSTRQDPRKREEKTWETSQTTHPTPLFTTDIGRRIPIPVANRYVQTDLVFIQKRIVKPSFCWGSAAVTANNVHHNRYTFVCVIEMNGAAKALCAMKYAKTSTLQSISKKQGSKVSNTHYAQKNSC